jgi:hypothetical protein
MHPMTPTVERIRQLVSEITGHEYNHAVVLLYRDGQDCIGFHKVRQHLSSPLTSRSQPRLTSCSRQDKTLDLDEAAPIASVSLGVARPYILRDNIQQPTVEHHLTLPHGCLLLLGPQTNLDYYHSIRLLTEEEAAQPELQGVRVSLTFRRVLTYTDAFGRVVGKGQEYQTRNWPEQLHGAHRFQEDLEGGPVPVQTNAQLEAPAPAEQSPIAEA